MTNQQRQLIRDIFEEALSISPDKWSCLLEQRAGHDAIVKSEVEVLLAARKLPPENETRSMACNAEPSQRPARPASPEGRFLPGDMFAGRYRIVSLLGRGGMGEVYRAHDLKLEEAIALKLLPSANLDANRLERFRNEVERRGRSRIPTYAVSSTLENPKVQST